MPSELDDFSEVCAIRLIRFLLTASEKQIVSCTKNISSDDIKKNILPLTQNDIQTSLSDRRCYALNTILKQKCSFQFLQESARSLSFECVLTLLQYLHALLKSVPTMEVENASYPSLEQVIDW